jgi:uncharacterized membrane protein
MQATNTLELEGNSDNKNRALLWFLAPIATINVFLAILLHWHLFAMVEKFLAVVLFVGLLLVPAIAVWGERTGRKKMGRFEVATFAYMYLMLTASLFVSH